jgi:uncharacterized membrane protein YphA (DoxX/SURF4 family)
MATYPLLEVYMSNPSPSLAMKISLWASQVLLALVYLPAGFMKLMSPVEQVAAQIPWADDVPQLFLRFIGLVDLAAGLGILLPALIRFLPQLTLAAALGSIALQTIAMGFHGIRGEFFVIPFNLLILGLSAFVLWGRSVRAPLVPRMAN